MDRRPAAGAPGLLGAVLAGGRSRRYGEDKALVTVGDVPLIRRAAAALGPATERVVLVANDLHRYAAEGLETRPDLHPGIGALGGVHTAVTWAAQEGLAGAVILACDMPFVPSGLLCELAGRLRSDRVVMPASPGPRGVEPLCGAYGAGCLAAIEAAIRRGDRAVVSFFDAVDVHVLDSAAVASFGDPETMFFNVNRPGDRVRAEALLARVARPEASPADDEGGSDS